MGYRSNGAIWLSGEAQLELTDDLRNELNKDWETDENGVWSFHDWKWYDMYDSVLRWIDFMNTLDKKEISYDFIRLGEDSDDNEVRTHEKFCVSRSIDYC